MPPYCWPEWQDILYIYKKLVTRIGNFLGIILFREMGDSEGSAPACQGSSLGSKPDISQKYKMGDKNKGVATKTNVANTF